ncbi:MAG TPA: glycoside hydrolase family 3 C-terminal domain-containing protein [Steroidobacteraceae bacterium]|nr:glycoside hydrolase family 3 C-terminal domain-containing protein [Steroidobacteraceae bacterium]
MRMNVAGVVVVIAFLASALTAADAETAPPALAEFKDPSLPPEVRVKDLISNMTLEEKAAQLGHTAPAIPRLGIPEYNWWNEGLHGVARADIATVFPQAIGMAASWDVPLMQKVANVLGTEFRAKYMAKVRPNGGTDWYRGLTVWSPNINIFRDPRWGRGQETYGEDPFLTSRLGVSFVSELQGSDSKYLKAIATPKHFAVHSGPESTRHTVDVHVSRHDLEDTYLPAFRATVMEAKAQSVMCAYNAVNGEPACANGTLLQEHLRKDWGFQGYVVSDCGAAADIFIPDGHRFAPNAQVGVTAAFEAGMDLICGDYRNNMSTELTGIVGAVRHGLLPESVLDRALTRLFTARIKLGMFDPPGGNIYSKITASQNDTPAHREIALRMAKESLVLLKNNGDLLPLKETPGVIAVIGPNADNLDALVGNYNGTPSRPVTILAGIRARFPQSKVVYVQGTGLVGADESSDQAVEAARKADLVVMVAGLSAHIEGEEMKVNADGFAGGDRTSLDLPAPQEQLLQRVQAAGKPTVLVLMNGSALGINWADQNVPAIVEAWYPGGQGGTAVAALLAGDFSPAGRLPVTFYKSVDQLPPFDDYSMSKRTYRYFAGEPLYPFGYGLSFTTFGYSNSRVSKADVAATDNVTVCVDVANSGAVAGEEVVQLYLTHPGVPGAPLRALKGFQRIHLDKGEKRTVLFTLRARDLSIVDESGKHRIVPGRVDVWVGGAQPVSRKGLTPPAGMKTQFAITSGATLPD